VALAFVLVLGTSLLLKSLENVPEVDAGFQTDHLFRVALGLASPAYAQAPRVIEFERQFLERIRAVSGVEVVAIASNVPLSGAHDRRAFRTAPWTSLLLVGPAWPQVGTAPSTPTSADEIVHVWADAVGGEKLSTIRNAYTRGVYEGRVKNLDRKSSRAEIKGLNAMSSPAGR
jgi:hypothetical protein